MGAHPGKPKSDQSSFLELIAYCVLRPVDGTHFPITCVTVHEDVETLEPPGMESWEQ